MTIRVPARVLDLARRFVPRPVRLAIQRHMSFTDMKLRYFRDLEPLASVESSPGGDDGQAVRFGIIRNSAQNHAHFVAACQEMDVPFRVLDLFRSDWLGNTLASGCHVLLVWPDAVLSTWNAMVKDRVTVLARELGYPTVPSLDELWLYEDKRRQAYWLEANRVAHPRTWVFYERTEAFDFCRSCDLPIVMKTSFGAASCGVRIIRSRGALKRIVRLAFSRGIVSAGADLRDRQWGSVILQEYLPDVREWRLVRIGDSYFGHPKGRRGEFHSGSGFALWDPPEPRHLDFLYDATEAAGFRSMNVDAFETPDGRLLVNELQAVFGASVSIDQCRVDGKPGRFVRVSEGRWEFEAGDFARNACANERVRDALARGLRRPPLQQSQEEHEPGLRA